MAQHKWHKEIKAWADGAEIECKPEFSDEWRLDEIPRWYPLGVDYRIKPQPLPSTKELVKTYTDAIIDVVCNGKLATQPKEPQYLYVWQHDESKIINLKDDDTAGSDWSRKGKIKLEDDDVGAT